jgi:hypothetical protein
LESLNIGLGSLPCRVLVTGLGRSGTSAVAAMLFHAGFNISGDAIPDEAFFEDEHLRSLLLDSKIDSVEQELTKRAQDHQLVAWKDPKLYSKYGRELLDRLPDDWIVVAVFRDPVAIASRRLSSDQAEFETSLPHVIKFMQKLYGFVAQAQKRKKVICVSYEKLVTEPVKSIQRIFRTLGAELPDEMAASIWGRMRESQQTYLKTIRDPAPLDSDV